MTEQQLQNEQQVREYMALATSEEDWKARMDSVKRQFVGYPDFWFSAIIESGLSSRVADSW